MRSASTEVRHLWVMPALWSLLLSAIALLLAALAFHTPDFMHTAAAASGSSTSPQATSISQQLEDQAGRQVQLPSDHTSTRRPTIGRASARYLSQDNSGLDSGTLEPHLTVSLDSDGMLRLNDPPDDMKRPFKMEFLYEFAPTETIDVIEFVQSRLMPAVQSYLRRWIRVRHPSGPLNFRSRIDANGDPIQPGNFDADLVVKVTSLPKGESCYPSVQAKAALFDPLTKRPIFGNVQICNIDPTSSFTKILQDALNEMMHVLGFSKNQYEKWIGHERFGDVVRTVRQEEAPSVVGVPATGEYQVVVSPNVVREARAHFGCPTMVGALMGEFPFDTLEHWSMRHYPGSMMRGVTGNSPAQLHLAREAMTDVTLAVLQDTGWYDVKYGSGGFDPYGYQAGCVMVNGTFEEILADPVASQYVCAPGQNGNSLCLYDFSGQGVCGPQRSIHAEPYDDLFTVDEDFSYSEDCQSAPGARCINQGGGNGVREQLCQPNFACSASGQVTVDGLPCTDELMCGTPGLLTCATPELNDCNGRGDCKEGRCFCHLGFGGDDCTVPICTNGCGPGEPCPPSGFCGVPECGEWSVGDTGKGIPCTKN